LPPTPDTESPELSENEENVDPEALTTPYTSDDDDVTESAV
jgi:hypothetical protein